MPRSIDQTSISDALGSLKAGMEGAEAAFLQLETYYAAAAAVDLDAHPHTGLEVLHGMLQRLDGVARTLRRDCLESVERLWNAVEGEMQTVQQDEQNLSATRRRDERERREEHHTEAATASRLEGLEEQRQVNRLLREPPA